MNNITSSSNRENLYFQSSLVVAGKFFLTAAVTMGLALTTFLSGGAVSALVTTGAASWKAGLATIGCIVSGTSLLGSAYFSVKHNMMKDTGENGKDIKNFLIHTAGAFFYLGKEIVDLAWNPSQTVSKKYPPLKELISSESDGKERK